VIPRVTRAITTAVSTTALLSALLLALCASPGAAVDTASAGSPQGNVTPTITAAPGVAVVAQSAPVEGRVALLLHNGTTKPVRVERITAVATRPDGGLAVRARTTKTYPQLLGPDQLALAAVKFRAKAVAPNATITAKVRSMPVSASRAKRVLAVGDLVLSAPMTGSVAQTMGATVTNGTSHWTAAVPQVAVMCFGEASTPTTFTSARASSRRIRPGATASATVRLASLCPTYLVAARAP
jgi:hypothetical protein